MSADGTSLQGQAHPYFSFLIFFSPHPAGIQACGAFLAVFDVFTAHPLHFPSCRARREFPGVAGRLPPRMLGGGTWRPACSCAGIPATLIESIDQIEGFLGAVH